MELNKIKQLLEKYYDGTTSIDEEQILKDFFLHQSVPAELEADKELFAYAASEAKTIPVSSQLEQKLSNWIDKQEGTEKKVKLLSWSYRIAGIAACIAIVLVVYFTQVKPKKEFAYKDTYDNPQLAYAEAKRALLYISQKLNKGTEPLSQVSKLNTGMDELSSISSLHDGFEQLELVSKYYNTSENENKK